MKFKFYEVQWTDSQAENGWDSPENIKYPTKLVKSYGFIIKESKQFITIAADWDEETKHFNRFIHIPVENLRKKRIIKI